MYHVEWDPGCFAQFDAIVASGVSLDQLKNVIRHVDAELSVDPMAKAQALSEGLYKLDVLIVRVYFHVDNTTRVATVDAVRWIGC